MDGDFAPAHIFYTFGLDGANKNIEGGNKGEFMAMAPKI